MATTDYYTADMVRALPDDGNRYEVVHGELLVTPAPRAWHQEVTMELHGELRAYLKQHPVGKLYASPADISWGPDILVQPDLFVVDLTEGRTYDWARMKTLLLAVEVLSPFSTRADRFTKRLLYQQQVVPLYWVIDPDAKAVEVWTPTARFPTVERERLTWHPAGAATAFQLALSQLFQPL